MARSSFEDGIIDSGRYDEIESFVNGQDGRSCAAELFSRRFATVPNQGFHLRLKQLREMNGSRFDHIEIMFHAGRRRRRICFVGHRFIPAVEKTLRWNLRQVLEPYNVRLDWSGRDIRSISIFDSIVGRIKEADFCIFDNRATAGRPNVYIEAGVAYAVKTPFILFEYARQGRISIPTDLSHCFAIRYTSYQNLFRELYAKLPVFFEANFPKRA
ncbi:MAG: hypothetical protein HY313_04540 [Acidobacteria bacterium]|nr:hypothetical protein [Acidobacteriota bacterium]